ncbi:hypothetical protein TNIN_209941 [Trichonephila inaurata madagascariensis]|uniref:Uncharacterized protein n=1 Tax=Trichonephila inaurata madagascariensis TaxID=2747483 RepID=A0A8X6XVL9_9ARAC|nr:hypothetical protein TNIN_209941 [Trichonephila inaurata madagascariensis]
MATAGHASSIHVINAENQNLKTMLTDISPRLSRLETHEQSTSSGPERSSHRRSTRGNTMIINIVGTTNGSSNVLRSVMFIPGGKVNHVYSSWKTRVDVPRPTVFSDRGIKALSTCVSLQLFTAIGTAISTYDQSPLTSDFEECSHDYSLLPQFRNLEADFLRHYGLLVDIRMDARWTG